MKKGVVHINSFGGVDNKKMLIPAAFHTMLATTDDLVFVKDMNLVYVDASEAFVKATGKHRLDEIIGKKDSAIFENPMLAKKYVMDDYKLFTEGKDLVGYIEPLPDEHGHPRYGSTSKYILKDENGNHIGVLGITRDITQEYMARQRYQTELQYLFELPEDAYAVSYIDVDAWRIIAQRRQDIGGNSLQACVSVEELSEVAVDSIIDKECEAADFYLHFQSDYLHEIYSCGRTNLAFDYQRRLTDGSLHWVHNEVNFLRDVDSNHLCVMLSAKDIDEEKDEELKLIEAAKYDRMTMVYNRETTMEYIQRNLIDYSEYHHALFIIDADNFKSLNDTMGHQTGDEFLIDLAKEIRAVFSEGGLVGRIGGDEFFAFLSNIEDLESVNDKSTELIMGIRKVCAKYPEVNLSGSVGVSIYPEHGVTVDELYARADLALYYAKNHGKNQFVIAQ